MKGHPDREKKLAAVAAAHDDWAQAHASGARFDPSRAREKPGSDYNLHYLDVSPPPGAEEDFHRRVTVRAAADSADGGHARQDGEWTKNLSGQLEVKVGPKGYVHGWRFVGVPGTGHEVHHPQHGKGIVTHSDDQHVHVKFSGGATHVFERAKGTTGAGRIERDAAGDLAPHAAAVRQEAAAVRGIGGSPHFTHAADQLDAAAGHFDAGREDDGQRALAKASGHLYTAMSAAPGYGAGSHRGRVEDLSRMVATRHSTTNPDDPESATRVHHMRTTDGSGRSAWHVIHGDESADEARVAAAGRLDLAEGEHGDLSAAPKAAQDLHQHALDHGWDTGLYPEYDAGHETIRGHTIIATNPETGQHVEQSWTGGKRSRTRQQPYRDAWQAISSHPRPQHANRFGRPEGEPAAAGEADATIAEAQRYASYLPHGVRPGGATQAQINDAVRRGKADEAAGGGPAVKPFTNPHAATASSLAGDLRADPRHNAFTDHAAGQLEEAAAHLEAGRDAPAIGALTSARRDLGTNHGRLNTVTNRDYSERSEALRDAAISDRNTRARDAARGSGQVDDTARAMAVAHAGRTHFSEATGASVPQLQDIKPVHGQGEVLEAIGHLQAGRYDQAGDAFGRAYDAEIDGNSHQAARRVQLARQRAEAATRNAKPVPPPLARLGPGDNPGDIRAVDHLGREYNLHMADNTGKKVVAVTHNGLTIQAAAGDDPTGTARELAGRLTASRPGDDLDALAAQHGLRIMSGNAGERLVMPPGDGIVSPVLRQRGNGSLVTTNGEEVNPGEAGPYLAAYREHPSALSGALLDRVRNGGPAGETTAKPGSGGLDHEAMRERLQRQPVASRFSSAVAQAGLSSAGEHHDMTGLHSAVSALRQDPGFAGQLGRETAADSPAEGVLRRADQVDAITSSLDGLEHTASPAHMAALRTYAAALRQHAGGGPAGQRAGEAATPAARPAAAKASADDALTADITRSAAAMNARAEQLRNDNPLNMDEVAAAYRAGNGGAEPDAATTRRWRGQGSSAEDRAAGWYRAGVARKMSGGDPVLTRGLVRPESIASHRVEPGDVLYMQASGPRASYLGHAQTVIKADQDTDGLTRIRTREAPGIEHQFSRGVKLTGVKVNASKATRTQAAEPRRPADLAGDMDRTADAITTWDAGNIDGGRALAVQSHLRQAASSMRAGDQQGAFAHLTEAGLKAPARGFGSPAVTTKDGAAATDAIHQHMTGVLGLSKAPEAGQLHREDYPGLHGRQFTIEQTASGNYRVSSGRGYMGTSSSVEAARRLLAKRTSGAASTEADVKRQTAYNALAGQIEDTAGRIDPDVSVGAKVRGGLTRAAAALRTGDSLTAERELGAAYQAHMYAAQVGRGRGSGVRSASGSSMGPDSIATHVRALKKRTS